MDTAHLELELDDPAEPVTKARRRPPSRAESPPGTGYRLSAFEGVDVLDGEFHAVSLPYWLKLEPMDVLKKHRWIRLRYSSSFFDEPVRPLIRFITSEGRHITHAMNGAVLGSAEWVGRIPRRTVEILISPGRRLGPFSFRIDDVQNVSRAQLLREGIQGSPPSLLWSLTSKLINSPETTWHVLKYARGGMPMERYWEWRARLSRPLDLAGLDSPRSDWSTGPTFHLLLDARAGEPDDLSATLGSLADQAYPHWLLHAHVGAETPTPLKKVLRAAAADDPRIVVLSDGGPLPNVIAKRDWTAVMHVGDLLQDYALAVLAETASANPAFEAVYSDEDIRGANGLFQAPLFKPDWSPHFHRSVRYLGRLLALRVQTLTTRNAGLPDLLVDEEQVLNRVLDDMGSKAVGHVRRVLYHRCEHRPRTIPRVPTIQAESSDWPDVSIIIPTRDRADLLATCIRSLKQRTDYPSVEVVIVDNGTTEPAARRLIDGLRKDPGFTILNRPGPFNYARLSNDGAHKARGQMLVFLNNDTELVDNGWLKALVGWARRPEIGVAGAKLLFPNGKIQHAGVILGMGGIAGHVYRRSLSNMAGYLHQLEVAREVTAVTAACIAVDRAKFEAIGGFDEQNLPVDLNDIDLCLRIAERGWTNIWTPEAVAIHLQSASRGVSIDPFGKYRHERTYFVERWAEAIRDDPYFHPGFSLFAAKPSLA